MRVAFFVNPVAGYGLHYNEKDSGQIRGFDISRSISVTRAHEFLSQLDKSRIEFLVPEGVMGAEMIGSTIPIADIFRMHGGETTSEDTRNFVGSLDPSKCDLLVFVGGDGTAYDVLKSLRFDIPVLGIPSGLKMYSGVFAQNPIKAAQIVNAFDPVTARYTKADILDMDVHDPEKAVRHFGELRIPLMEGIVAQGKTEYSESDIEDLIDFVLELLDPEKYYFVSTGYTCKRIIQRIGYETNPLGIDLIKNGKLIEQDLDRKGILRFAALGPSSLIVSPLGGQNFLFGRGNRQVDSSVISAIGFENVMVIAGQEKMMQCRSLLVDIPDADIPDFVRVISGYGRYRIVPIQK